jgi:hypothetical protein
MVLHNTPSWVPQLFYMLRIYYQVYTPVRTCEPFSFLPLALVEEEASIDDKHMVAVETWVDSKVEDNN